MKQREEMTGYVGNVRKREDLFDKEFYKTYESELIPPEKNSRLYGSTSKAGTGHTSTTETKKRSNVNTHFWLVGFIATLVVFISSKTGSENIKRVITDCGKPSPIRYGSIIVDDHEGTKYGSKASVVCSEGYSSSKSETVCQSNGKWSPVYCHVTDCGQSLPAVDHGQLTLNAERDSTYGATATVLCAPGYERSKKKVTCQENGRWVEAICKPVDCAKPHIDRGKLEFENTIYMSEASVKCEPGYAPSQPSISCTSTGVWQNAQCYNVDDCSPNPCLNSGVCVDKIADFSCQCPRWFSGKTCEIDNQPCRNHKCLNGATCENGENGGYTCKCALHWDGHFCERHH